MPNRVTGSFWLPAPTPPTVRVRSGLSPDTKRPEDGLRLAKSRRVSRRGGLQGVQQLGALDELCLS